jgi:predicted lipoprotein with Yx(FWY)xxD motif
VIAKTLVLAVAVGLAVSGGALARADASAAKSSATLTARSSNYGSILFDGRGQALYAFTRDRRGGASRCYGACAKAWPVYFSKGRLAAGRGVKQGLIGTTRRRDGRLQVTYDGRPLYYYQGDAVGQVKCQGVAEFGGTWLVVRPSGKLVR